ncbi:MAG: GNAT family N-acetyltransferase [Clostridia bacterium]|nr:GNAT family N-acetyltransferase [Clostridia bacterium]
MNPFDNCPTYETVRFTLRLVTPGDAADLLACYREPTQSTIYNSDNCDYGYGMQTEDEMRGAIERWLEEYRERCFIRYTVTDRETSGAIGTIEVFPGFKPENMPIHGVLRIDLRREYETTDILTELMMLTDTLFAPFDCEKIVTRVSPDAPERIIAAEKCGFHPYPGFRSGYYVK